MNNTTGSRSKRKCLENENLSKDCPTHSGLEGSSTPISCQQKLEGMLSSGTRLRTMSVLQAKMAARELKHPAETPDPKAQHLESRVGTPQKNHLHIAHSGMIQCISGNTTQDPVSEVINPSNSVKKGKRTVLGDSVLQSVVWNGIHMSYRKSQNSLDMNQIKLRNHEYYDMNELGVETGIENVSPNIQMTEQMQKEIAKEARRHRKSIMNIPYSSRGGNTPGIENVSPNIRMTEQMQKEIAKEPRRQRKSTMNVKHSSGGGNTSGYTAQHTTSSTSNFLNKDMFQNSNSEHIMTNMASQGSAMRKNSLSGTHLEIMQGRMRKELAKETRFQRKTRMKKKNSSCGGNPSGSAETMQGEATPQHNHDRVYSDVHQEGEVEAAFNLGEPNYTCSMCQAIVWYEERSEKTRTSLSPDFSICCMKGKIELPLLKEPPLLLLNLNNGTDPRSKHFKQNIRAYNSMFSFTSIGGKVDTSLNNGSAPPQFTLCGQNYHRIGSLLPENGTRPKFAQLYIYDTNNEIANRMNHFRSGSDKENFDASLVQDLQQMIDEKNVLAQLFRRVRDVLAVDNSLNVSLRLYRSRSKDPRTYNLPTCDEVAALIVGDISEVDPGRDIIVKKTSGQLERIYETHASFIPLQYPLLFPLGQDGWQDDIPIRGSVLLEGNRKRITVSLREFIAFRIQERVDELGTIVNAGRLFQQFVVDAYTMIESRGLSWYRQNQHKIRCDVLSGIQEAVNRGDTEPSSIGTRIILPPSFTGGARFMFNNCQDAMAICKKMGFPDLFITITCNSNWKEISDFVRSRNLKPDERPDIVCRVFKMKVDNLISDLKKEKIFGEVDAGMYTIEFQKRGLPHAHILLWLHGESKLTSPHDIDKKISAELPDPQLYPRLYDAVSTYMMHGPCGKANPKCACMKNGKCTKYFPKKFQNSTTIDDNGYPHYRRRQSGIKVMKNGIELDSRSVVPYNPKLLMRYQAHINVEYCNKSNSIKYLFKYVNKGPDRVTAEITTTAESSGNKRVVDEIKQYYDCRYLSPCEAVWRTFKFEIHERWPPVKRLKFHLENQQSVLFEDHEDITDVLEKKKDCTTMFLAWMDANKKIPEARSLTYSEFPSKFVYNEKDRIWELRKQGYSIGRLTYIPPGTGELYYMRMLLAIQRGCTSFESIRTVKGEIHSTYQKACYALGLLSDDKQYIGAIREASELGSGNQLRGLFVSLLITNSMSRPDHVWESTWQLLSEGIEYSLRMSLDRPDLIIEETELKKLCLLKIDNILQSNGKSLADFTCFSNYDLSGVEHYRNKFVVDEMAYNSEEMQDMHANLVSSLTDEQRKVHDQIMGAVTKYSGIFYFVYGYGGTGKTYIWKTLSAGLRAIGKIVLNVASSGIASLLLPGGRTAHSRFSIPLNINETSTCKISKGSLKAKLLQQSSLIIWDEAPMLNRFCFEALDRTLKDIMSSENRANANKPFGGKVVVLGGDFRQILPVIQKGSRQDIVAATVNSSYLWENCKVLSLTKNMRLLNTNGHQDNDDVKEFAEWILKLGNGESATNDDGEMLIDVPHDLLITDPSEPLLQLIQFVYPDMVCHLTDPTFYQERAILAPTLESVEKVNQYILSCIEGEEKEYLSCDSACKSDEDNDVEAAWLTPEFLHEVKCSGIPNHKLVLKKGVPVMLLRNLDQSSGLCNGTRLLIEDLCPNVIGATVVTGTNSGKKVYIGRMSLIPQDSGLPFKFERRQFPLAVCYAMTINKSQGQSLSHVGLYLPRPVFTHGQFYVAVSRVKSRKGLRILILDDEGKITTSTTNVVYREVFENI